MNEKYNLENIFKKEAEQETARLFQPKDERRDAKIKELLGQYQIVMAEYERLEDEGADESITAPLLDSANQIFAQINELDPNVRGSQTKTIEESEFESAIRKYKLDHPKDLN